MDPKRIEVLAHSMRRAIESVPLNELPIGLSMFPRGACGDASMLLGAYLRDQGVSGFVYILGQRSDGERFANHAWLSNGTLVVDITADQFADAPAGVIVATDSAWHQSFEQEPPMPSDFREWDGPFLHELHNLYDRLRPMLFERRATDA